MCPNDGCDWTGELRNKAVKLKTLIVNDYVDTTVLMYTFFVTGSLGILPFPSCALYERELSRDIEKKRS